MCTWHIQVEAAIALAAMWGDHWTPFVKTKHTILTEQVIPLKYVYLKVKLVGIGMVQTTATVWLGPAPPPTERVVGGAGKPDKQYDHWPPFCTGSRAVLAHVIRRKPTRT